jgi:prepilin-type N-terminal cleavage/methylation domain-containing protein
MNTFEISNLKSQIPRHRRGRRGFTLIEIMVATAVMIVLVGLVVQITSQVLNVWSRSSGQLSANAEARVAMNLLTQDLETAVFRNNGLQWLRVESGGGTGGPYAGQTVALNLFSPALDRPDGPGDLCAIAYRLSYKETYAGGENVYALYRFIETPQNTFDTILGASASDPKGQLGLTGGIWAEANVTGDENYLASNIVDFKVLVYEDDGTVPPVPANADSTGQSLSTYAYGGSGGSDTPLLYADIILTVVSDDGLKLLQNIDRIPETADEVVREYGETFTRRVPFMSRPL